VLAMLLERHIITPQFAASLLMIDFPNPVFSPRRRQLMQYVPQQVLVTASGGTAPSGSDLQGRMVAAMEAVEPGLAPGSPEREFLLNQRLPTGAWQSVFEGRITSYFAALAAQVQTVAGFDGVVRLADSRRREFRSRPLAEFSLTLPTTNIPKDAPFLEMREDGAVHNR
jgi:hypothetical protein